MSSKGRTWCSGYEALREGHWPAPRRGSEPPVRTCVTEADEQLVRESVLRSGHTHAEHPPESHPRMLSLSIGGPCPAFHALTACSATSPLGAHCRSTRRRSAEALHQLPTPCELARPPCSVTPELGIGMPLTLPRLHAWHVEPAALALYVPVPVTTAVVRTHSQGPWHPVLPIAQPEPWPP